MNEDLKIILKSITLNAILVYMLFVGISLLLIYLAKHFIILRYLILAFVIFGIIWILFMLVYYLKYVEKDTIRKIRRLK